LAAEVKYSYIYGTATIPINRKYMKHGVK